MDRAFHSDIIANISHEIRTPLAAITGYAEILASNESDPKKREWCEGILKSSLLLERLVNDILEFSKASSETFSIRPEPCDVRGLVQEVVELMHVKARYKSLELSYRRGADAHPVIVTDPARLKQILFNIIGNAIKFTEVGYVRISDELVPSKHDGFDYRIHVQDTGRGIKDEDREKLFSPYFQTTQATDQQRTGTGLGLAISQLLAKGLGGQISFQSEQGIGTTFTLSIAAKISQARTSKTGDHRYKLPAHQERKAPLAGRMILLADDSPDIIAILNHVLENEGATIKIARDGHEALEYLRVMTFDLAIMDVQMPRVSGLDAARITRASGVNMPILILSAKAELEGENLEGSGVTDFMSKPIDIPRLLEKVSHLCSLTPARSSFIPEKHTFPSILLIEDDNELSLLTDLYLNKHGYNCTVAPKLADARDYILKSRFDYIMLDLNLPDGRGISLFDEDLGEMNEHTPVIISSGGVTLEETLHPRVRKTFQKPYRLDDLVHYLEVGP